MELTVKKLDWDWRNSIKCTENNYVEAGEARPTAYFFESFLLFEHSPYISCIKREKCREKNLVWTLIMTCELHMYCGLLQKKFCFLVILQ